jgi:hypothetical protein
VRRLYLRSLPLIVLPGALIALGGASTGVWLALAVAVLFWVHGFVSVIVRLRRERA